MISKTIHLRKKLKQKKSALTFALALMATFCVQAKDSITIAYQYGPAPTKWAQAQGLYEKASGKKINWRLFENGADVAIGLTSGDVDIGLLGSAPIAAFSSRGLKIKLFFLDSVLGSSEALVVRNEKIKSHTDLNGKTIATPFVSTSHFALLSALKYWGINPQQNRIVNLKPAEIIAAWQRGDIDAAYTWDPALSSLKASSGHVLTDSRQVASWGSPTFDGWVARSEFADKNQDFLQAFVEVSLKVNEEYRQSSAKWTENSEPIKAIANISGSKPKDVVSLVNGNDYKDINEQLSAQYFGGGLAKVLGDTAAFLKEQKSIDRVLDDYSVVVDDRYLRKLAQP